MKFGCITHTHTHIHIHSRSRPAGGGMKLGKKGKDVDSFVDKLELEGQRELHLLRIS